MCADIHDGREHKRSFKGRIQKRKTNHLQIIKSSLQRTAGPYKSAIRAATFFTTSVYGSHKDRSIQVLSSQ